MCGGALAESTLIFSSCVRSAADVLSHARGEVSDTDVDRGGPNSVRVRSLGTCVVSSSQLSSSQLKMYLGCSEHWMVLPPFSRRF